MRQAIDKCNLVAVCMYVFSFVIVTCQVSNRGNATHIAKNIAWPSSEDFYVTLNIHLVVW